MSPRRYMLVVLFFSLGATQALAAADPFAAVREQIRTEMVENATPSLSVAVARNGRILWEEGFGWADRERRMPATEHTMYGVASVTKPLTATALMTLVQAGKIDLDKPANDYLGAAKLQAHVGNVDDATVRRLANHSSGLPLHHRTFRIDGSQRQPSMSETLLRYGHLVAAPGEEVMYSNLGFGALGAIIEHVSGQRYADFMRRELFIPLGMTHTSVGIGAGLERQAAARYDEDELPIAFYETDTPAAAAVYASAHDLVRFGLFHLNARLPDQKQILSAASLEEMHRRTAATAERSGYGVGFGVSDAGGHRVILHSGGQRGASSLLAMLPDQGLVVVVLCNSRSRLPRRAVDSILTRLVPDWRGLTPSIWEPPPPFITPAELLGSWQGTVTTYSRTFPVTLSFRPDGLVRAQFDKQMPALVDRAKFEDGVFSGELLSRIGTEDTESYDYKVSLALRLRGDVLNGAAMATSDNVLASWLELRKQ